MDLVHGDIKPDNILIDHNNRAVIGDFGLTKNFKKELLKGIYGTPNYQSPENYENFYRLDERIDIFNVGIVFYEMVAGIHPFVGGTDVETVNNTMALKYPAIELHSAPAISFLKKTLCVAPARLYRQTVMHHEFIAPLVPNALAGYISPPPIISAEDYETFQCSLNLKNVTDINRESEDKENCAGKSNDIVGNVQKRNPMPQKPNPKKRNLMAQKPNPMTQKPNQMAQKPKDIQTANRIGKCRKNKNLRKVTAILKSKLMLAPAGHAARLSKAENGYYVVCECRARHKVVRQERGNNVNYTIQPYKRHRERAH